MVHWACCPAVPWNGEYVSEGSVCMIRINNLLAKTGLFWWLLIALAVACCYDAWGVVCWGSSFTNTHSRGGLLLWLWSIVSCCHAHMDPKLLVKWLSGDRHQHTGNSHFNFWLCPVWGINTLKTMAVLAAPGGIALWLDSCGSNPCSSHLVIWLVELPCQQVSWDWTTQMFEAVSVHHALHSLLAASRQTEFKFTFLLCLWSSGPGSESAQDASFESVVLLFFSLKQV